MAQTTFTAEPESFDDNHGTEHSKLPPHVTVSPGKLDPLQQPWNENMWANSILKIDSIRDATTRLDKRLSDFVAVASQDERELLDNSRRRVLDIIEIAKSEHSKHVTNTSSDIAPSIADRVKNGWKATAEVAYEYTQMLDVMVGQAPEYIALAYGAIKILLVVQVNNEELKRNVKDYMDQIMLKFKLIDHLTSYIPASNIVIGVTRAYSLFYRFLAKAVKYYTQNRLKTYFKAFTKPWKRFQDLVDSIEQTLSNIKDTAQYYGLIESHMGMVVSQKNLVISQHNSAKIDQTLGLMQDLHTQMQAISISFSKERDIRQTADALMQRAEEKLNEPTIANGLATETSKFPSDPEVPPEVAATSNSSPPSTVENLRGTLFAELGQFGEDVARKKRAIEEFPEMRAQRSENRNFMKSEKALAWAESNKSQILWVDGNQILSRADFNASFAFPLLLIGESNYETVLILRHFCEHGPGKSDQYLVMMQALLFDLFLQNPSVYDTKKKFITRDQTCNTSGLWDLLLACLDEVQTHCVFIVIGSIDHLTNSTTMAEDARESVIGLFKALMDDKKRLVKILLTTSLTQPPEATIEAYSSLIGFRSSKTPKRALSFDAIQNDLPLIPQQLTEFQEKRRKSVKFTEIPMLYTPGIMIFVGDGNQRRAFVVSELSGMDPRPLGTFGPLCIRAWSIDHNGVYFCKQYHDFTVPQFPGRKVIAQLKHVPTGYLPEESTRRKELIKRGRLYWTMGSCMHYMQLKGTSSSRVIIDQCRRPIEPLQVEQFADQLPPASENNLKPRFLMLCPPDISAYSLQGMNWTKTHVENIHPLEQVQDAFADLVILSDQKKMLLASLSSFKKQTHNLAASTPEHPTNSNSRDGLIILLHGAPGTGKSMTAQCLANYVGRPLLPLSPGRIGVTALEIQAGLTEVFQLANQWGCIVLMDDADVYVEQRSLSDMQRNSVVTVLLRALEEFEGVLILTTNRIGTFDEAFKSRIQLIIHYKPFDNAQRHEVWRKALRHLEDLGEQAVDFEDLDDHIYQLGEVEMNGREIRNAITTARHLIQFSGERFTFEHLWHVLSFRDNFEKYLKGMYDGISDRDMARDRGYMARGSGFR